MLSLTKYLKKATFIPFGITIITGIILSITHDGSQYKSEWSTDDGFVLTMILTILLSGLISLLSLSVLLTKYSIIKNNLLLCSGTWIFIPGSLCLFVIYLEFRNFTGDVVINGKYAGNRLIDAYIMSVALLHLTSLIISYLHYIHHREAKFKSR